MPKSAPKAPEFKWDETREQAALLIAQDELTDTKIAEKLGVARRTLGGWKENTEFSKRVQNHLNDIRSYIRSHGISIIENRVAALQDRWDRMKRVIAERAESPEMQNVAGGTTGLLVRQLKKIGAGADAEIVEEFVIDAALLKEMREHEKQAAQELGQWSDKHEHAGTNGGPIKTEITHKIVVERAKCAAEFDRFARQSMGESVLPADGN